MPSTHFGSPVQAHNSSTGSSESPFKSPQVRKEILREAYEKAQALQHNVTMKTIEDLEEVITQVDAISEAVSIEEKIKNQGEVLLDSEIMVISTNVLQKCTTQLNNNISTYDPHETATKIKIYLSKMPDTIANDQLEWHHLGNEIIQLFQKTAKFSMILGTLQPIPKKVIVRRKIVKEVQGPLKRPEKIVTTEQVEDSIEKTIMKIIKIVGDYQKQNKKPVDFFTLVLHPTDFGKTIENILHVSFLIRDGVFKFTLDENGIPQIEKAKKEELADVNINKKKRNVQNVLSLTMKQWRALVKAYKLERPMINIVRENTE